LTMEQKKKCQGRQFTIKFSSGRRGRKVKKTLRNQFSGKKNERKTSKYGSEGEKPGVPRSTGTVIGKKTVMIWHQGSRV